ncbi:MAG TPA: extracellular solute-binding protein, partial [Thermoanaerobaculia bacterium]|nr:extracellular solute-binding protein [Thermoanaerobaculia bacterium]
MLALALLAVAVAALWLARGGWRRGVVREVGANAPADGTVRRGAAAAEAPSGPLTVYCGRPEPLMAPLFDRFGERTRTSLVVRYGETWPLEEELVHDAIAPPAAVFVAQDAAALGALSRKGLLLELPLEIVQQVEPRFAGTESKRDWAGLSARARAIVYDPATMPAAQLPQTLDALAEERFAGRFGFAPSNDSFQAQLATYRVLAGRDALTGLLRGLKGNRPRLYVDNGAVVQAVARGEIAFGLVNHYSLWRERGTVAAGRLAIAFMNGGGAGGFVNAAGVGVLANDPRAFDLVRFLLSPDAQRTFAEKAYEYPLAKGLPPPE